MGLPAVPGLIIREFFNSLTLESNYQSVSVRSPLVWIALLLASGVARIVAIFIGRITKTQHRFTMSSLLQRNLLDQLLQKPGAAPLIIAGKTVSPSEVISFFRDDATQIEDNVVGTNEVFGAGVFALISLIILLNVNKPLTLLVFLPLIAIAITIQYAETRIKRYRSASRQATQQVTGLIGEMFSAVQAIQVAGAENTVLAHLHHLNEQRRQRMVQDQVFTAVLHSSLENLVNVGIGLILLVAAQLGLSGDRDLNVGDFALFVYFLTFITDFLWFLGGFIAQTKQTEVSFERMEGLIGERERIVEQSPLYLPDLKGRVAELPAIAQPHQDTMLQELRAVNLTYRYPGSNFGITNINLTLQRGSLTVITGQVGSGKTTLLQVLLGLLPPQSGEIYWNGLRVTHPDQFFVPPRSAYASQVPHLFSNTLRENLLLGLQVHETELNEAIALSALDRDLAAMTAGLNTVIGSRGMRLSGGQQQRTAAARVLVRQPELLVFDDLSSALDLETEQTLWSRLLMLKHSTLIQSSKDSSYQTYTPTFLVVSHRPFVLRQADHIILLQDGNVAAAGKLENLKIDP